MTRRYDRLDLHLLLLALDSTGFTADGLYSAMVAIGRAARQGPARKPKALPAAAAAARTEAVA